MATVHRIATRLQAARTALMTTGGFTALTAATWTAWGTPPGLAATGVSLLVLEYLTSDEESTP